MKKVVKIVHLGVIISLTFILMGFGCTPIGDVSGDVCDIKTVEYKPDTYSNSGQMAVCFDNKIYFVSQEKSRLGIYSMSQDGTDVSFEYPASKMSRLIITDRAIYYVGRSDEAFDNQWIYSLFKINLQDGSIIRIEPNLEYSDSVYDAYVFDDERIAMLETKNLNSSIPDAEALSFSGIKAEYDNSWGNCFYQKDDKYKYNVYFDKVGRLYFSSADYGSYEYFKEATVVDAETGNQVMGSISHTRKNFVKLLGTDNDILIFGEYNSLVFVDFDSKEKEKRIELVDMNSRMWIDYIFRFSDNYIVVATNDNDRIELFNVDVNRSESVQMMSFNSKRLFLHAEEDKIYYAQGNKIICKIVSEDGLGKIQFEIEMPKKIVKGNLFEIAGEWLFIYERSDSVRPHKLLYRVNLLTKEVVDLS